MPIQFLNNTRARYSDGTGKPLAQGTVGVYVAGTSFATLATVWDTVTKDTELTNPVTLDDAGEAEIWYDVEVDIRVKDSTGAVADTALGLNPNASVTAATGFNLADNGSFETDSTANGQPDSWTISEYSGSAVAISSSIATDGTNSLEFNTAASGTGGGIATSSKFPATESAALEIRWSFYATHASTLNTFVINWFQEDGTVSATPSTTLTTMPASGSAPTSWTRYYERVSIPSDATQGQIVITGISNAGPNLTSKAYFDGMKVIEVTDIQPVIYDSVGNEAIKIAKAASAVNEITVTNAVIGNSAQIKGTGEATAGLSLQTSSTGELDVNGNEITYSGVYGSHVLLDVQDLSASSSDVDLTTGISSTYEKYIIEITNLISTSSGDILSLRVNTLGGGVDTGNNYEQGAGAATNLIQLATGIADSIGHGGLCGEVVIHNPAATDRYKLVMSETITEIAGTWTRSEVAGAYVAVTALDGFRLSLAAGNITATVRLFGVGVS